MSDFLQKMQQVQNQRHAAQNGLGELVPADIDSIVNRISSDIENRMLKQASGQGMIHTQTEGNFLSRTYEYRYYHANVPVIFQQKSCSAIYYYGGGESDSDNERYYVGVRNLEEAKQISIAIMRRLYAGKMQIRKQQINKSGQHYFRPNMEFYSLDEVVRMIQKSATLNFDDFTTSVYYIVSKIQKR